MKKAIVRTGDMHPNRALRLVVQEDGDVIVLITQDGIPIGDVDLGDPEDRAAQVEFCTLIGGGRSRHTLKALKGLIEAMEKDNAERPITERSER
ncbi:MAG: hypothetical protein Q8O94_04085 [bacterium]|nr:hypothetical protein [bacterium]